MISQRIIQDKTISLMMSSELKEAVERKADRLGISFSEAVRSALVNAYAPSLGKESKAIRFMKKTEKSGKKITS
jgi:hypothetical protein